MPIAYYGSQISPHLVDTPEGFLICKDVPIARTGPQDYLARELMLDGDPERVITVQRYPEDVFEDATLASGSIWWKRSLISSEKPARFPPFTGSMITSGTPKLSASAYPLSPACSYLSR